MKTKVGDFYEDDEDPKAVWGAFRRGPHYFTFSSFNETYEYMNGATWTTSGPVATSPSNMTLTFHSWIGDRHR
jgi:hypothetical protein